MSASNTTKDGGGGGGGGDGGSSPSGKPILDTEKRMRREIANSNERRRMQSINAGFQNLRSLLPRHEGEKLSKVSSQITTRRSQKRKKNNSLSCTVNSALIGLHMCACMHARMRWCGCVRCTCIVLLSIYASTPRSISCTEATTTAITSSFCVCWQIAACYIQIMAAFHAKNFLKNLRACVYVCVCCAFCVHASGDVSSAAQRHLTHEGPFSSLVDMATLLSLSLLLLLFLLRPLPF